MCCMDIANGVTVQRWIPVTERLPDSDGNYIVTACDEGCSYGEGIWYDTVVVVAEYYKGSWTWNENGTEYDLCGIVTHWMCLPEPPKEDGSTMFPNAAGNVKLWRRIRENIDHWLAKINAREV